MIARTVREMINLLDDYPLGTPIMDRSGFRFQVMDYRPHDSLAFLPVIRLAQRIAKDYQGSTVLQLSSILIDISMDSRFNGLDATLMSEGTNYSSYGREGFVLVRGDYPVLLLN